jgi:hypothetical protein
MLRQNQRDSHLGVVQSRPSPGDVVRVYTLLLIAGDGLAFGHSAGPKKQLQFRQAQQCSAIASHSVLQR